MVRSVAEEIVKTGSKSEYASFPGVQLYVAVARLVPALEGVIYRCRDFIETSDWLHMKALFGFRDFKYNNYLYGQHVDAIFEYLSYPSRRAGKEFKTVSELQDFMLFELAPKLEEILKLSDELEKLPSENFEFKFDRTLLVGRSEDLRFIDPEETEKLFIKPYFYTIKFLLQRTVGSMYYIGAMDLNELPVVFNRVIRKTTINNFVGDLRLKEPAKGVTPEMTYQAINSTKSFLKWRSNIQSSGKAVKVQNLLDRAFYYGVVSSQYQLAAYVCGLKYPSLRLQGQIMPMSDISKDCSSFDRKDVAAYFVNEGDKYLFNPNSMVLNFKQKYNMFKFRVHAYAEANKGRYAAITSDVTGKTIDVFVKALFNEKVSQRDFLPISYLSVPASSSADGLLGVHAWNYDHGKPIGYKDFTFGGFFNKSQVFDTESLYKTMATLLYTDAISPFGLFIRVPSTANFFIRPTEIINQ
jgi:hypothetical protein